MFPKHQRGASFRHAVPGLHRSAMASPLPSFCVRALSGRPSPRPVSLSFLLLFLSFFLSPFLLPSFPHSPPPFFFFSPGWPQMQRYPGRGRTLPSSASQLMGLQVPSHLGSQLSFAYAKKEPHQLTYIPAPLFCYFNSLPPSLSLSLPLTHLPSFGLSSFKIEPKPPVFFPSSSLLFV